MSAGTTRLQRAFEQMRRERLLVEENCACCSTCAHAHCFQLLADQPDKVGYLFYHGQDLDTAAGEAAPGRRSAGRGAAPRRQPIASAARLTPRGAPRLLLGHQTHGGHTRAAPPPFSLLAENGRLYLGHAARPGMPDKVPPLVAVQCLADHGLQVWGRGWVRAGGQGAHPAIPALQQRRCRAPARRVEVGSWREPTGTLLPPARPPGGVERRRELARSGAAA